MIPGSILVFMITFIILFGLAWMNRSKPIYNRVPKKIWSYWKNPDVLPATVQRCIESWKKHNPEYEIVLMNKKNYMGYVTIPKNIRSHYYFDTDDDRFSDLLRLYALAEHGGIWMDPGTIVKEPFDNWLFLTYGEFSGFYTGSSSWIHPHFLACNKNSAFLQQWKEEFVKVTEYVDSTHYVASRQHLGKIDNRPLISIAAQKVLQLDNYPMKGIQVRNIEEGPFRYLHETAWNFEKGLQLACRDTTYQHPILFLRREVLDEIEKNRELDRCGWFD